MTTAPVERSDDPRRGEMRHIKEAIAAVSKHLATKGSCADCRRQAATHLVDARRRPRTICGDCAGKWQRMTPTQRMERRHARLSQS